jgi:hypothetical protein
VEEEEEEEPGIINCKKCFLCLSNLRGFLSAFLMDFFIIAMDMIYIMNDLK